MIQASDFDTVFEALLDRTAHLRSRFSATAGDVDAAVGANAVIPRLDGLHAALAAATAQEISDVATLTAAVTALQSYAIVGVGSGAHSDGEALSMASLGQVGGFTAATGDSLQVPAAGVYEVSANLVVECSSTNNPTLAEVRLVQGSTIVAGAGHSRATATPSDQIQLSLGTIVTVTTPASERLSLKVSLFAGTLTPQTGVAQSQWRVRRIA